MQKIKISILLLFMASALIMACKKKGLIDYQAGRYVQFDDNFQDTILVSFFLYPGQNKFIVDLPINMTGHMTTQDLSYSIQVNAPAGDLVQGLYALPGSFLFKKGSPVDTARIVLNRTEQIKGKQAQLVLDLVAGNELMLGQRTFTRRVIKINDKIGKPSWWDDAMTAFYLGEYSDKKYQAFIDVVGQGDLEEVPNAKRIDLMLEFKYYLIRMKDEGKPVLEANGNDMLSTIPLIG